MWTSKPSCFLRSSFCRSSWTAARFLSWKTQTRQPVKTASPPNSPLLWWCCHDGEVSRSTNNVTGLSREQRPTRPLTWNTWWTDRNIWQCFSQCREPVISVSNLIPASDSTSAEKSKAYCHKLWNRSKQEQELSFSCYYDWGVRKPTVVWQPWWHNRGDTWPSPRRNQNKHCTKEQEAMRWRDWRPYQHQHSTIINTHQQCNVTYWALTLNRHSIR